MTSFLVTGGAGFIGSHFVDLLLREYPKARILVLDALTYAGHLQNLADHLDRIVFVHGDIGDFDLTLKLMKEYRTEALINFAAESHVDRSIQDPTSFVRTNVMGVAQLLRASKAYWDDLSPKEKSQFRFLQVSTDEVFGSLGESGFFTEESPYRPNSPYAASKAAGDHLVRSWFKTYQLPCLITHCSNNYGPRQYPEKLIPLMIRHALQDLPLPVYGTGLNKRDWIHVLDHCRGILLTLEKGRPGESYCFGAKSERTNLEIVHLICSELDELAPRADGLSHKSRIQLVEDRKGHDWRYAVETEKAERELGFQARAAEFELNLKETIRWSLRNQDWVQTVMKGKSK